MFLSGSQLSRVRFVVIFSACLVHSQTFCVSLVLIRVVAFKPVRVEHGPVCDNARNKRLYFNQTIASFVGSKLTLSLPPHFLGMPSKGYPHPFALFLISPFHPNLSGLIDPDPLTYLCSYPQIHRSVRSKSQAFFFCPACEAFKV